MKSKLKYKFYYTLSNEFSFIRMLFTKPIDYIKSKLFDLIKLKCDCCKKEASYFSSFTVNCVSCVRKHWTETQNPSNFIHKWEKLIEKDEKN